MPTFATQTLLEQLRQDTLALAQTVQAEFAPLSAAQLTWEPGPGKWSIAQCLEHLNRFGHHYIPAMEAGIGRALRKGQVPQPAFRSGWLGNYLVKSMQPFASNRAQVKYPAPKKYNPSRSGTTDATALPEFLRQQDALLDIIFQSRKVNMNRVRVPVSVTNLIQLKLGDCLRFVMAHNQRHIQQAQKVRQRPDFPK